MFVHGLGGPVAVGDQWEDDAHGDDGGLREAGPRINVFLSVFIHSVGNKKSLRLSFQDGWDRLNCKPLFNISHLAFSRVVEFAVSFQFIKSPHILGNFDVSLGNCSMQTSF